MNSATVWGVDYTMKTNLKTFIGIAMALPVMGFALSSGVKSGLKPGDSVITFGPTFVTGVDAGMSICPVCKYGATPAVQVWVNGDKMENVSKIADTLDASIKMQGANKLKAFIIFIKPNGVTRGAILRQLRMVAEKCHLANVALAYVNGPKDDAVEKYKINTNPSVKTTIMVYHNSKVDANFVNLQGDEKGIMSLKSALMTACGKGM